MDFTILLRETAEEALTLSPATQKKEGAACSRPHFINTLANAKLVKNDQMRQIASENYEVSERQTVARPLAQR